VTATILYGKALGEARIAALSERLSREGIAPSLATILVGDDAASMLYVGMKERACRRIGGSFALHKHAGDSTTPAVASLIRERDGEAGVDGILLQLPLPAHAGLCGRTGRDHAPAGTKRGREQRAAPGPRRG